MANMSLEKNKMPEQKPEIRRNNFEEVALGYTKEMAIDEAKRCLNCKNKPCVEGCPVNVRIPEFIKCVAEEKFDEAYDIITSTNALPAICGRVCPQETQCENKCVRGLKGEPVGIGRLERFVADYANTKDKKTSKPKSNSHKIAVVGSGPSGLTCASDLAKKGYDVTIFEALHKAGGVLVYGIPEFRLPKALVQSEIDKLTDLGVKIDLNSVVGKAVTVDELIDDEGYEAVYVASGAGLPKFQGIEGENSLCVYSANEYLTRINLMKAYKFPEYATPVKTGNSVAVVGGGNVAMDSARCAKRMGAENVYVVYRRSEEEMPARKEEVHHAKEEGIEFKLLNNPTKILSDESGFVKGIELIRMELGEPDASGRRRPVEIKGSEYVLDVQTVIIAIGNSPNPLILSTTPSLKSSKWGGIIADEETGETSEKGVYAGGDAVTGAATVILAMGAGKKAADAIDKFVKEKK